MNNNYTLSDNLNVCVVGGGNAAGEKVHNCYSHTAELNALRWA